MAWMRNTVTGSFVGPILDDSPLYMDLRKFRDANQRPSWEEVSDSQVETALAAAFPAANLSDISQVQAVAVVAPALTANAPTVNYEMGNASRAGAVIKVAYIPNAAVTGQATNSRTLNVVNGGASGAGTTNVAALALLAGVNLVAGQENAITLSGTLTVNPGDAIQWQSALVGTGLVDPGGIAIVTIALAA